MEFKGKFRTTYDTYKEFQQSALFKNKPLYFAGIILIAMLIIAFSPRLAFAYVVIAGISFATIKLTIKKGYYENQKDFMQETTVTVNQEGIREENQYSNHFFPVSDVIKCLETRESFFLFVAPKRAVILSKRQFASNNHINRLRAVIRTYYQCEIKLRTDNFTGSFSPMAQEFDNVEYSNAEMLTQPEYNNININSDNNSEDYTFEYAPPQKKYKVSVFVLYVVVCVGVLLAVLMPSRLKSNTADNPPFDNGTDNAQSDEGSTYEEALTAYINAADKLLALQTEYKTNDGYLDDLDNLYSEFNECYHAMDFYVNNRSADLVILYHLDSLCFDLMYVMEKPYSQLNYIELEEYNKLIDEIQNYRDKLYNLSGDNVGKV